MFRGPSCGSEGAAPTIEPMPKGRHSLSKSLDRDFRHCRARYQRLRDAKFGSGWVVKFTEGELVIRLNSSDPSPLGSRCFVEVFGTTRDALLFGTADSGTLGPFEGPVARFVPDARIGFRASMGEARYVVEGVLGAASVEDEKVQVTVLDVSGTGLAVLSPRQFERGQHLALHVLTPFGETWLDAEVRYSRKDRSQENVYRTGLKILKMDRLDAARWRYFQDQYRAA